MLYELLTGARAFSDSECQRPRRCDSAHRADVAREVSAACFTVPERVVRKCLAKDPNARWQSARDLGDELQWVAESVVAEARSSATLSVSRNRTRQATWALIFPPADVTGLGVPALSPDGRTVVFEAWGKEGTGRLWLHALTGSDARVLLGTECATLPFFSPDGRSLGFFADGSLRVLDLASGRSVTLTDGCRIFATGSWAGRVPGRDSVRARRRERVASYQRSRRIDRACDVTRHQSWRFRPILWPHFLPDGRHFLFVVAAGRRTRDLSEDRSTTEQSGV